MSERTVRQVLATYVDEDGATVSGPVGSAPRRHEHQNADGRHDEPKPHPHHHIRRPPRPTVPGGR